MSEEIFHLELNQFGEIELESQDFEPVATTEQPAPKENDGTEGSTYLAGAVILVAGGLLIAGALGGKRNQ